MDVWYFVTRIGCFRSEVREDVGESLRREHFPDEIFIVFFFFFWKRRREDVDLVERERFNSCFEYIYIYIFCLDLIVWISFERLNIFESL